MNVGRINELRSAWEEIANNYALGYETRTLLIEIIRKEISRQADAKVQISDDLLWQEIYSLREKLKITVEAIKSYDPDFDTQLFMHQLNSVDYDQLMEELSGMSEVGDL